MFDRAVTVPVIAHVWRLLQKSCLGIIVLLVLLALASSHRVWAQTATTGEITGVVTDPAGAVLPNGSVTLKNIETGATVLYRSPSKPGQLSQGSTMMTFPTPSTALRGNSNLQRWIQATSSNFASPKLANISSIAGFIEDDR